MASRQVRVQPVLKLDLAVRRELEADIEFLARHEAGDFAQLRRLDAIIDVSMALECAVRDPTGDM